MLGPQPPTADRALLPERHCVHHRPCSLSPEWPRCSLTRLPRLRQPPCTLLRARRAPACRFIKNNLLVELSTMRFSTKLFSWVLRRHTMVAYALYMGGGLAVRGMP